MTLEKIKLVDRKKLTSHYPVLLASETGTGKSMAFANLSDAEKTRTVIFNFDNKAISEDDSQFGKIYHEFNITDIDMVENIRKDLIKVFAFDKVDRVFLDTFTLMTKLFNRWASEHYSGFDVWNAYNNAITSILETIKSCTMTYAKFSYVSAHYPPKHGMTPGSKRYVTTKGKEHTNIIEESFSTVVETIMEDRKFYFVADVFDESNTTKTKMPAGEFKIPRVSIDDLEQVINKRKQVVNDELVAI